MKARTVIEAAASGCVVYVLMAACSGGGGGGGGFLNDAASDAFGFGGSGGGAGGFLSDVLGDPVSEAQAAPPEIKEAQCVVDGSGNAWADLAFPGRTITELARAEILLHYSTPQIDGYDWASAPFSLKDGSIRVYCYYSSSPVKVDLVRAILPVG